MDNFQPFVPFVCENGFFNKFCVSKYTNRRVKVVDMYDSDQAEVAQVQYTGMGKSGVGCINDNHFQTLGKTPIWALAHCLDLTVSERKSYYIKIHHLKSWASLLIMHLIIGILNLGILYKKSIYETSIFLVDLK